MARREHARQAALVRLLDGGFSTLSRLGRLHPAATPARHGVTVQRNVPYRQEGAPLHLDVYRPAGRAGLLPVVLYIHGGGFRALAKDTHWLMGLAFARRGFVVFNIDYRLAPTHPFPAAPQDVCAAYRWVVENAHHHGGDSRRLLVAGESAGANLAVVAAVAACWERPEPWARAVFETGVVPRAILPACGALQVSDPARLGGDLPFFARDVLAHMERAYLGNGAGPLADPLRVLEDAPSADRPLPPFYAPVGTADPLLDDTRRLAAALERRGVRCEARYFPGEVHAFHALLWRRAARECWREMLAFAELHSEA